MSVVDLFVSGYVKSGQSILSAPGLIWKQSSTTTFESTVYSMIGVDYGDGKWVAVGDNGKIVYSTDADTWTAAATPSFGTDTIARVAYGGGKWVAVGANGKIAYSTDANTWTQAATPSFGTSAVRDVAYGNNLWVAVGSSGKIAYSTDANTWTQAATPSFSTTNVYGVTYGGGKWVAVGGSNKIAYSTDANTWTQATVPGDATYNFQKVDYGNGKFVAVKQTIGQIFYSATGTSWSPSDSSGFGSNSIFDIEYSGGVWIAVGGAGNIARSFDGISWGSQTYGGNSISQPFGSDGTFYSVAWSEAEQRLVVVGYLISDSSGVAAYSDYLEAGSGIVEQGANSNGSYIIFSSGVQVCWSSSSETLAVSTAYGNLYRSAEISAYTYPKAFASAPVCKMALQDAPVLAWLAQSTTAGTATTTPTSYVVKGTSTGSTSGYVVAYIAIGTAA